MDYDKFKKEYDAFQEWNNDKEWEYLDKETPKNNKNWELPNLNMYDQASLKDGKRWLRIVEGYDRVKDTPIEEAVDRVRSVREDIERLVHERFVGPVDNDGNFYHPEAQNDMVNSPAHYTRGSQEVIDIIEESIQDAPDVKAGMLQAQTLKYLLRLWLKGNAPQDSEKARWYLNRLIEHLGETK
tara:strand:- start:298 stop:849 length:552 start_codon:yes stop_codon:yes gene_type:complete